MVSPNFWQGKRVFITGHTGFKGSWLSLWLQHMGATLTGYALTPNTNPNLFEVADVAHGMNSIIGDIRDLDSLQKAITASRPQIVFHLAAQALVGEGYRDPLGTFSTNVQGTANLLEAVRNTAGIQAVVVITSDKCYENKEWPWPYRENEALGGHDPYSSSKACAELVTAAYRLSFLTQAGIAIATARAGNVFGGGDWSANRLIPDLLAAFSQHQTARLRRPHSVRPWQHVLEPLAGICCSPNTSAPTRPRTLPGILAPASKTACPPEKLPINSSTSGEMMPPGNRKPRPSPMKRACSALTHHWLGNNWAGNHAGHSIPRWPTQFFGIKPG